jgi:3'-phosphoadenosine 5'-phosphosulfate sulfotransferase (PAPS reductase)/FAD synthetase
MQRLSEAEYRAKVASGEIVPIRADAHIIRGDELIAQIQRESGHKTVLMAFSGGKDALAAYLHIRTRFERVVPFYMYGVPDLEFIEESLRYYERNLTDEPIIRLPHPSLYEMLGRLLWQPPERVPVLEAADLLELKYTHRFLRELVCEEARVPDNCFIATGVRADDSPMRRLSVVTYGPINRNERTFMPIWDWRKAVVMSAVNEAGLRLPVDYEMFGRTFDGFNADYLIPIRDRFPRDYQRILEWFPLADTDIFRKEHFSRKLAPKLDKHGNIAL